MTPVNPLDTPSAREVAKKYPQGSLLGALLGAMVFGGVSAFMTGVAPVSHIELVRKEGHVAARVETCVFYRWPYRTELLVPVTGVSSEVKQGEKLHKRAGDGKHPNARAESQGYLTLESKQGDPAEEKSVRVTVHHSLVKGVRDDVSAFLADDKRDRFEFRTETHPIIGTWVPLLFTIPMTALCAFGLVAGSIQRVVQLALKTLGPRTEAEPER